MLGLLLLKNRSISCFSQRCQSACRVLGARNLQSQSSGGDDDEASAIDVPSDVITARPEEVLPILWEINELRNKDLTSKGLLVRHAASQAIANESVRLPAHSWVEMTYPFLSNPYLRDQYRHFNTHLIRIGLILEDVDGFAGDIARRHAADDTSRNVTASVDKITWLQSPPEGSVCLSRDLRFTGQVSWTGSSSMEVLIEAHTRSHEDAGWKYGGLARFVMVARDNKTGQAVRVAALQPQTQGQNNLFTLGHYNREVRKRKRETSLMKTAPAASEIQMLHELLKRGVDKRAVSMSSTQKTSVRLMNSQDRNVSELIYGGYLLKEAYELAYATAMLHANEICEPILINDVAFLHPVPIGSIVEFSAQVAYAVHPTLRVNVRATMLGQEGLVTNDFTIAFRQQRGQVTPVMPVTLAEAWAYIHAYRQHIMEKEAALLAGKNQQVL